MPYSELTTGRDALVSAAIAALTSAGYSYNPLTTSFSQYLATALTGIGGSAVSNKTMSVTQLLAGLANAMGQGPVTHLNTGVDELLALVASVDASPLYLGQVATKCYLPNLTDGSNKQLMGRSPHFARDDITQLKIVLANWIVVQGTSGKEAGTGGTAQFKASIEYPSGTFTQVLFSGSSSITVGDLASAVSDFVTISIPAGARFWVRIWASFSFSCAFSYNPTNIVDATNGQATAYAASGLADQTMGGTITNLSTSVTLQPVAIVGMTRKRSFILFGDSRTFGFGDTAPVNSEKDRGELAPAIGAKYAYINAGAPGTEVNTWLTGNTRQLELAAYCSDVISEYGINGFLLSRTPAQILMANQSLAVAVGKPTWLTTLPPVTTSSDSWATVNNQTVAAYNADRITYNNLVRAIPDGISGCIEVADVVESARDSGKWKAPGYTADGIHETSTATEAIRVANANAI